MPLYEYACEGCQKTVEVMQKFSDPVLTKCTLCGSDQFKKLISRTSFTLKGSGWYATDYKKQNTHSAPAKSDDKPASSDSASKSDTSAQGGDSGGKKSES